MDAIADGGADDKFFSFSFGSPSPCLATRTLLLGFGWPTGGAGGTLLSDSRSDRPCSYQLEAERIERSLVLPDLDTEERFCLHGQGP